MKIFPFVFRKVTRGVNFHVYFFREATSEATTRLPYQLCHGQGDGEAGTCASCGGSSAGRMPQRQPVSPSRATIHFDIERIIEAWRDGHIPLGVMARGRIFQQVAGPVTGSRLTRETVQNA